jgi:hypothetical protein
MPRSVSNAFWEQVTKRDGDDPYMAAVDISHPVLSDPIRVICNDVDVTIDGNNYIGMFFDLKLPGETDQTTKGELVVQNVDQRIGRVLKTMTDWATLRIFTVLRSDPSTTQQDYRHLTLRKVKVNALTASGEVWGHDISGEPCPARRATKEATPGLWI